MSIETLYNIPNKVLLEVVFITNKHSGNGKERLFYQQL